jgi:hypothetical protein
MSSISRIRMALLATFALIFTLPCLAQKPDDVVTLQFVSFPKSIDPKPVELLLGEGKTLEVKIPTNALSGEYKVKRLDQWVFGKSTVKENDKISFETYGQAHALGSPKQIILLVRKGAENADGMEIIPIENNAENFGGGIFFFMNAATVDIAGIIGDKKFALKPGKFTTVTPKIKKPNPESKTIQTQLFFRKNHEPKPFFSSIWPLDEKARSMIFFYHDPHTKRLRMHTIRDFLP